MKCTFLKRTEYYYIQSSYNQAHKITEIDNTTESFQDCIKKECSAYREFNGKGICKRLK